jgi:hypothetical protein
VNKFDPQNWRKLNSVAVPPGAKKQLKGIESPLLLVRWTRAKHTPAVVGTLESMILSPLGTPATPTQQFNISDIADFYEFWQLQTDGLPYSLIARLDKAAKHSSQLVIWEFLPAIVAPNAIGNNPQNYPLTTNPGVINVSFTAAQAAAASSSTGTVTSVTASISSFVGVIANAARLDGFGVNNSNKVVWVLFSSTSATTAKPSTPVPVGGNFDIPTGYVGAVQLAIAPSAGAISGTIDITEFIAQ